MLEVLDGELMLPGCDVAPAVVVELGVVPGTVVLAPGMPVVAPGTPTLEPGTLEAAAGVDAAAPRVPDVGVHGRDPSG